MTRGRKKDLTIPPTRALVQQRDYRARRAQYVAELEQRVRQAEEENAHLRTELTAARASQIPPGISCSPQLAHASAELMQSLSAASNSLARFQQIAIIDQPAALPNAGSVPIRSPTSALLSERQLPPLGPTPSTLRPASFPSPAPSPPFNYGIRPPKAESPQSHYPPRRKRLYREDSPDSSNESNGRYASHRLGMSRSPSIGSEYGGLVGRHEHIESSDDHSSDRDYPPQRSP